MISGAPQGTSFLPLQKPNNYYFLTHPFKLTLLFQRIQPLILFLTPNSDADTLD